MANSFDFIHLDVIQVKFNACIGHTVGHVVRALFPQFIMQAHSEKHVSKDPQVSLLCIKQLCARFRKLAQVCSIDRSLLPDHVSGSGTIYLYLRVPPFTEDTPVLLKTAAAVVSDVFRVHCIISVLSY